MKYLIMAMYFFAGKPVSTPVPMVSQSQTIYRMVDRQGNEFFGTKSECLYQFSVREPVAMGGKK